MDFARRSDMALYPAAEQLFRHKRVLEEHIFATAKTLFDLRPMVNLYDVGQTPTLTVKCHRRPKPSGGT
ncbi:MAG: hypothetical protein OXC63_14925 [Aestuariivita sp.]|nr:hypothetical protein [Aestuariivita sp.]MCY4346701.1 hypothetical protein [Aestuariivita sp.]